MASLYMRFPGGRAKAVTLSYDDGVEQDIKLIEIMKKYGLKGTFNLNSGKYATEGTVYEPGTIHRRMTEKMVTKVYKESGQEVAVHGLTHPFLEQLPVNIAQKEIWEDRNNLEQQFGVIVRGMAYPFGTFNDTVVDILKNNGIVYSRTVISSHNFYMPADWLRLEATCHHNDPKLEELTEQFIKMEPQNGPQMFYLWGHSYEFEDRDNWDVIENFAKKIGGHDDIWYATNIEIYDYEHAFKQLLFTNNMHKVYNPTVTDVNFVYDFKSVSVPAGATVEF